MGKPYNATEHPEISTHELKHGTYLNPRMDRPAGNIGKRAAAKAHEAKAHEAQAIGQPADPEAMEPIDPDALGDVSTRDTEPPPRRERVGKLRERAAGLTTGALAEVGRWFGRRQAARKGAVTRHVRQQARAQQEAHMAETKRQLDDQLNDLRGG